MRKCKVKDCKRKYHGKGYCGIHYYRLKRGKPLIKKCKTCKKNIEQLMKYYYCKKCKRKIIQERLKAKYQREKDYIKKSYVYIPVLTNVKGTQKKVFTNGVTEEIKPLIQKIKNDVLNDCIKNPRKYLDDEDE